MCLQRPRRGCRPLCRMGAGSYGRDSGTPFITRLGRSSRWTRSEGCCRSCFCGNEPIRAGGRLAGVSAAFWIWLSWHWQGDWVSRELLHAAAAISDAPVSTKIVGVLDLARDSGTTPWDALAALGRDLGVVELVELASAVSLAGTEGARIESTLAAKAGSIRRHELADAETDANTITDRLFLPGVLLLVGFLIFIGYPAVSRLSAGL